MEPPYPVINPIFARQFDARSLYNQVSPLPLTSWNTPAATLSLSLSLSLLSRYFCLNEFFISLITTLLCFLFLSLSLLSFFLIPFFLLQNLTLFTCLNFLLFRVSCSQSSWESSVGGLKKQGEYCSSSFIRVPEKGCFVLTTNDVDFKISLNKYKFSIFTPFLWVTL